MSEVERLLVKIEGDTALLRREMHKGEQRIGRFERRATASVNRTELAFSRFSAFVSRSLLPLAGLSLSIGGITSSLRDAARIGDVADKLGHQDGKQQVEFF